MRLEERIQQELKGAMLARNEVRVSTLRLLKSALGYVQIERKKDALDDAEVVAVLQKEIKKRRESAELYTNGGRPELADKENKEAAVLEEFLPKAMPPEELDQLVRATIKELGATTKKDMGPVIKAVQAKAAGRADGKSISMLVGKLLA
jgi:uncharacterized protein YqeY